MQIIEYRNSSDVTVKFLDGTDYQTNSTLQRFKKHSIKNPYEKSIYGVGYLGVGEYLKNVGDDKTKAFYYWFNMMKRCYSETQMESNKTYFGKVVICDEWHNFQNFAKWFYNNIYKYDGGRLHIDKDILEHGNKIYSPDKCLIVPQRINMIFMTRQNSSNLPNGVRKQNYGYHVSYNGKPIGRASTLEEAIKLHDIAQQIHVRNVAEDFKSIVPEKVYQALINWVPISLREN